MNDNKQTILVTIHFYDPRLGVAMEPYKVSAPDWRVASEYVTIQVKYLTSEGYRIESVTQIAKD